MMAFLFTHRHGKGDKFLVETREAGLVLDFDIVRDVMYKYSKKAQEKFFSNPIESFFLIQFANSKEGENFILKKADPKEITKTNRIFKEMEELKDQAIITIQKPDIHTEEVRTFINQ